MNRTLELKIGDLMRVFVPARASEQFPLFCARQRKEIESVLVALQHEVDEVRKQLKLGTNSPECAAERLAVVRKNLGRLRELHDTFDFVFD